MTKDAKNSIMAFLSGVAVLALAVGMEFEGLNWEKWLASVFWTALVFGAVAYQYGESIDEISRCSWLFHGMLAAHILISILYLRSVADFPKALFFSSPIEIALVAGILVFLGGARAHRSRVSEKTGEH